MNGAKTFWSSFSKELLDWVYPPQCALCGASQNPPVCDSCRTDMIPMPPGADPPATDELAFRFSAFEYGGRTAQAVKRLKYERATSLAGFMAQAVFCRAEEAGVLDWTTVPVPIHWTRRCARGFNQAELIAQQLPVQMRAALVRRRATRPQVGLSSSDRQSNIAGAFRASPYVAGLRVMLVDDVVTSGNTARECARALLRAGALEVGVISFAGEL